MLITGKLVTTNAVVTVTVEGGRIAAVEPGAAAGVTVGGPDHWIAPGFCDIQVNGYGGYDFNLHAWGDATEVRRDNHALYGLLARSGTALVCPTVTTNSHEAMRQAFTDLATDLAADPALHRATPCLHMEGPYISSEDGPRGAHPLEHVRDPDWDEFERFQEAADNRVGICTLAPERAGALPFIERLVAHGVVAAIGHTAAEPEVIRDAVAAGATLSTHLGNGAHSMIRRHPNYIWEQLAHDRLIASVIADGHHLPASVVKCIARVKGPQRMALVSDAVALGGLPAGRYASGRLEVLPTGKVVLAGTPYLAGAGHLLDTCLANALRFTDLSLAEVIGCVTEAPARLLGIDDRKGRLEAGYDADLTLFTAADADALQIVATVTGGEITYRNDR